MRSRERCEETTKVRKRERVEWASGYWRRSRTGDMGEEDDDEGIGWGFSLPPIRLPPIVLPERIRFALPTTSTREPPDSVRLPAEAVLVAALVFDVFDALVVLFAGSAAPWLRAVVGAFSLLPLVGPAGLVYLWEGAAAALGVPWVALAPSATLLLSARLIR